MNARPGRAPLLVLAVAGVVGAAEPAFAQMRGEFPARGSGYGGRLSAPGPFSVRPQRGDGGGGPIWGGARPAFPVRISPWIISRPPPDEEEIVVVRPRPRPTATERAPKPVPSVRQAAPKVRPAEKKLVRQAAAPPPVRARPERPRILQAPAPRVAAAQQLHLPAEVVVELKRDAPGAAADELAREYALALVAAQPISLLDTTLHQFRIRNGQPVANVIRSLGRDVRVASAQPNFIFRLQAEAAGAMAGMQYARARLRLPEAQELTTGDGVTVGVIDSGVDTGHPELAGALSGNLDALGSGPKPDPHGTAIAGIIAARAKLVGAAPAARILAIEAFVVDRKAGETRGVSTNIVRAISLGAEAGVRLVNLSFAGPSDPLLARAIAAAQRRGTIFVAAAGNGGPKAPAAYPAADPNVIGVTATDAKDGLFAAANRGAHVGFAAPGVDVLVPTPGGGYKLSSGTSMAAAHVTGILALVMGKRPELTLGEARILLSETAKDLGQKGIDPDFGSGLVDARRAVERATESAPPGTQQVATVPEAP